MSTTSSGTSEQAHWDLAKAGQRIAVFYLSLSRKPLVAGQRWWIIVPELHWFQHLGNPRYHWCHADEDVVGTIAVIADMCHGTNHITH